MLPPACGKGLRVRFAENLQSKMTRYLKQAQMKRQRDRSRRHFLKFCCRFTKAANSSSSRTPTPGGVSEPHRPRGDEESITG